MEKMPWFTTKGQVVQIIVPIIGFLGSTMLTLVTAIAQKVMGIPLDWWILGILFVVSFLVMWWISSVASKTVDKKPLETVAITSNLPFGRRKIYRYSSSFFSGYGELLTLFMALPKNQPKKTSVRIRSHSFTPEAETTLKRLSYDATDVIGRTVSDSAVVRAVLAYVGQQSLSWAREQLYPHIEKEMGSGTTWGKHKS